MTTRTQPLAECAICGEGIYTVDESSYYLVINEDTGRYTSDPNTILQRGEDLDGKHVHADCLPDRSLCIDDEDDDRD